MPLRRHARRRQPPRAAPARRRGLSALRPAPGTRIAPGSHARTWIPDGLAGSLAHRRRGQSLVEFAIVFPVFVLMLGGVIQFGIIFWGQNTLNQIVRDAGRYGATVPDCLPASQADIVSTTGDIAAASSFVGTMGAVTVALPDTGSTPGVCPPVSNADVVWLRIDAAARVPIFFPLIPGDGTISSSARFRMEPQIP